MPWKSFGSNPQSKNEAAPTGFGSSGNAYEELGVTTVINAQGTMTMLGGSLMRPEVEVVMAQGRGTSSTSPLLRRRRGSALPRCSSCRTDIVRWSLHSQLPPYSQGSRAFSPATTRA